MLRLYWPTWLWQPWSILISSTAAACFLWHTLLFRSVQSEVFSRTSLLRFSVKSVCFFSWLSRQLEVAPAPPVNSSDTAPVVESLESQRRPLLLQPTSAAGFPAARAAVERPAPVGWVWVRTRVTPIRTQSWLHWCFFVLVWGFFFEAEHICSTFFVHRGKQFPKMLWGFVSTSGVKLMVYRLLVDHCHCHYVSLVRLTVTV